MAQIKAGDVVRLKSGGPRMTVSKVDILAFGGTELTAWCDWFEGNKKCNGTFHLHSLEIDEK